MNSNYCAKGPGLNWHEDFIVHLAALLRPALYVELGLYQCSLFNRVIPFAGRLIGVDINPAAGQYMQKSVKTLFVNSDTLSYARELKADQQAIDMLFIDADHARQAVLHDFHSFFPFVSPHGLILIHDTHPGNTSQIQPGYSGTAYEAAAELANDTTEYELVTIPVPPGLTICRKRKTQLAWQE